jgi:hypothetical protein
MQTEPHAYFASNVAIGFEINKSTAEEDRDSFHEVGIHHVDYMD